ncbi:hypothetical protein Acsp06_10740 [Actinomycetospora sp. NBRC 106375]|nr:hypothetical protein Acsp06_10740 [Actinomycetospora sp. NBRC 106375]
MPSARVRTRDPVVAAVAAGAVIVDMVTSGGDAWRAVLPSGRTVATVLDTGPEISSGLCPL